MVFPWHSLGFGWTPTCPDCPISPQLLQAQEKREFSLCPSACRGFRFVFCHTTQPCLATGSIVVLVGAQGQTEWKSWQLFKEIHSCFPPLGMSLLDKVHLWKHRQPLLCPEPFGFVSQAQLQQRWALPALPAPPHGVSSVAALERWRGVHHFCHKTASSSRKAEEIHTWKVKLRGMDWEKGKGFDFRDLKEQSHVRGILEMQKRLWLCPPAKITVRTGPQGNHFKSLLKKF